MKKMYLIVALIACIAVSACDIGGDDGMSGYTACYYDLGSSSGINSVRVLYPCDIQNSSKSYSAATLSGGMTNTKEDMYWLGTRIAENGFVVFALSAASNMSVSSYESAQEACYNLIVSENKKSSSPLFGKIGKIALMGYSMGGGAVLNIGAKLGSKVHSVVAMAPYNPDSNLSGMTASTLLVVGENDTTASPRSNAEPAYEDLPDISKLLAEMSEFGHLEWVNNTSTEGDYPKNLIISWLKYVFTGDETAYQNLINPPSKFVEYLTNKL
jgi:predicted dienelactone hydrolase